MADRHTEKLRTLRHLGHSLDEGAGPRVRVIIGPDVLDSPAGRALALTIGRLLPRVCERISFVAPRAPCPPHLQPLLGDTEFSGRSLAALADLIWDEGEFDDEEAAEAAVTLSVGGPHGDVGAGIDEDGAAVVVRDGSVPVACANAVFAAIGAAAIACSQIAQIAYPSIASDVASPLIRLAEGPFGGVLDLPIRPNLCRPFVAGVGAVGCAVVYALIVAQAEGTVVLLDPDQVGDTNLMRYILFDSRHLGQSKTAAAKEIVIATGLPLTVEPRQVVIQDYLEAHPSERDRLELVVSAVDTYDARRAIAGELPHRALNAGTTPTDFTVSRHGFGDGFACLACLYRPEPADVNEDAVAGRELGMEKTEVAHLRRTRFGLTEKQLRGIARHRGEDEGAHLAYVGEPFDTFYNKVVCATTPVNTRRGEAIAPLAPGSALAGFLLARALMDSRGPARHFRMDFMSHPNSSMRRSPQARADCRLCGQPALVEVYSSRWGVLEPGSSHAA